MYIVLIRIRPTLFYNNLLFLSLILIRTEYGKVQEERIKEGKGHLTLVRLFINERREGEGI